MERKFPVLMSTDRDRRMLVAAGCPESIPWSVIEPHAKQAMRNHDQTLGQLAERGGLSVNEMVCVLEDRRWSRADEAASVKAKMVPRLLELVR